MTRTTAITGRSLGAVSAALGLPAVLAPDRVAKAIGLQGGTATALLRAVGAAELAAASGLLTAPRPWQLWARVAGHTLDLGLLGVALTGRGSHDRGRLAAVTGAIAAITATDIVAALAASGDGKVVEARSATTINKPAAEVYAAWRRFDDFPRFMAHMEEVAVTGADGRTSHWRAAGPAGTSVEWDATITDDRPGERIAWRSDDGAAVPNSGEVRFGPAPGGRGTEVHVTLRHELPGGEVGRAVARCFGEDPRQQLDDDLRRFKQIVETGEVVVSDGAPWGKRARHEFPQRPAQPMAATDTIAPSSAVGMEARA
ncbi:MAG TPA: SRPBCC family protein [Acidimicrobiales bacterium]|nr:SRPBCC family protein [Acidimicrobiales bacterium]